MSFGRRAEGEVEERGVFGEELRDWDFEGMVALLAGILATLFVI